MFSVQVLRWKRCIHSHRNCWSSSLSGWARKTSIDPGPRNARPGSRRSAPAATRSVTSKQFSGNLGSGRERVDAGSKGLYPQSPSDQFEDVMESWNRDQMLEADVQTSGFYPHYLRRDLVIALGLYFFDLEYLESRRDKSLTYAYESFARHRATSNDTLITFNYDVALDPQPTLCFRRQPVFGKPVPDLEIPPGVPGSLRLYPR